MGEQAGFRVDGGVENRETGFRRGVDTPRCQRFQPGAERVPGRKQGTLSDQLLRDSVVTLAGGLGTFDHGDHRHRACDQEQKAQHGRDDPGCPQVASGVAESLRPELVLGKAPHDGRNTECDTVGIGQETGTPVEAAEVHGLPDRLLLESSRQPGGQRRRQFRIPVAPLLVPHQLSGGDDEQDVVDRLVLQPPLDFPVDPHRRLRLRRRQDHEPFRAGKTGFDLVPELRPDRHTAVVEEDPDTRWLVPGTGLLLDHTLQMWQPSPVAVTTVGEENAVPELGPAPPAAGHGGPQPCERRTEPPDLGQQAPRHYPTGRYS